MRNINANIYKIVLTLLNNNFKLKEKVLKKISKVYYNFLNVFNKKKSNTLLTFNKKNNFKIHWLKNKSVENIKHYSLY